MSGDFEVWVRGRRAITCDTRQEADRWAGLLGTSYAPATVVSA